MINFQLYFILIYLKIIINAECLQYLPELKQHPDKIKNKKQNMVMKTYTELLGTCIKSKKTRYINTVCTKSASKDHSNCFAIFGSSACKGQHAYQHVCPDMYSSLIFSDECPRTDLNLRMSRKVKKLRIN